MGQVFENAIKIFEFHAKQFFSWLEEGLDPDCRR